MYGSGYLKFPDRVSFDKIEKYLRIPFCNDQDEMKLDG